MEYIDGRLNPDGIKSAPHSIRVEAGLLANARKIAEKNPSCWNKDRVEAAERALRNEILRHIRVWKDGIEFKFNVRKEK